MTTVDLVVDELISTGAVGRRALSGCTASEIESVRLDQGVSVLPPEYIRFLERIGRGAGPVLVGSDAFYPDILGLKQAGQDLLTEAEAGSSLGAEALVVGMHQGYQLFWIPSVLETDRKVLMFEEGEELSTSWPSFGDYLKTMAAEI